MNVISSVTVILYKKNPPKFQVEACHSVAAFVCNPLFLWKTPSSITLHTPWMAKKRGIMEFLLIPEESIALLDSVGIGWRVAVFIEGWVKKEICFFHPYSLAVSQHHLVMDPYSYFYSKKKGSCTQCVHLSCSSKYSAMLLWAHCMS